MKRREEKKRAWKKFKFYAASSLVMYIVFMLIWAMVILIKINSFPQADSQVFDVFFADKEQDEFSSKLSGKLYKKSDLNVNGTIYLSTDTLNHYTPITEGGNSSVRTIYIQNSQASFDIGTTNAVINGQRISLSSPSVIIDSHLCVPMDFFVEYVEGINVEFDTEKVRFIVSYVSDIDFKPAEDSGSESISYDEYLQLLHNSKQ